jgi:hypothetical protein
MATPRVASSKHVLRAVPAGANGEMGAPASVPVILEHAAPGLEIAALTEGEPVTKPVGVEVRVMATENCPLPP